MMTARLWVAALVACALLLVPACGGGGGGGGPGETVTIAQIEVVGQVPGPFSPFGSTQGGDVIRITGDGFNVNARVFFGTVEAGSVTVISTVEIQATSPTSAAGAVSIRVRNPSGAEGTIGGFEFIAPPLAASVVALSGPTQDEARVPINASTDMELRGQDFDPTDRVFIGGVEVVVNFIDANTIRITAPALGSEASIDVTVTGEEGLSTTLLGGLLYTQEFSLEPQQDGLTEAQARHLYRRAGFGAPPEVIAQAIADGLGVTVNNLCTFSDISAIEAEALEEIYGDDTAAHPPANTRDRQTQDYWARLVLRNPNVLQERLAYFFHNHFATSQLGWGNERYWWMHEQINLFRNSGKGNWRDLCVAVSQNKAMMFWLDAIDSRVNNINENFARELWELFMLGADNGYLQIDIVEAAKAFTGFDNFRVPDPDGDGPLGSYQDIRYIEGRHDAGEKTILGVTGFFGYDDGVDARDTDGGVVDLTLAQRPVEASTFICRKLAAFFLYDDPHDVVVNELATLLRNNNWELEPVLRRILNSKALFSGRSFKGVIRNPIEFVFQFLRTTDVDLRLNRIRGALAALEQEMMEPPDVNGWPSGVAWTGVQAMIERMNFLALAIRELDTEEQIERLVPPEGQRSPPELVDHIARLLSVDLTGIARNEAIEYVTTELDGDEVVAFAFDPTDPDHLRMKTRGLLYLIGQYWDGHQN